MGFEYLPSRKFSLYGLITVPLVQALFASILATVLAWINSRNNVEFGASIIIYMLWVISVGLGGWKAVRLSKMRLPVLAGILSVLGAIIGYLFHWFMLYILSGADDGFIIFITNRLDRGIIIETTSYSAGRYFTEIGRAALLITWSLEPILYLYIAYLGGSHQAKQPFDEMRDSWADQPPVSDIKLF